MELSIYRLQSIGTQEQITVSTDKALAKELDRDISVVMRKRLIEGYSMDVSW